MRSRLSRSGEKSRTWSAVVATWTATWPAGSSTSPPRGQQSRLRQHDHCLGMPLRPRSDAATPPPIGTDLVSCAGVAVGSRTDVTLTRGRLARWSAHRVEVHHSGSCTDRLSAAHVAGGCCLVAFTIGLDRRTRPFAWRLFGGPQRAIALGGLTGGCRVCLRGQRADARAGPGSQMQRLLCTTYPLS